MFVLVGQILNSRGRFGPMMWAPIANNVISVGVLVVYLVVFGPAPMRSWTARSRPARRRCSASARPLGIVAQFLILLPYLRAAGYRYRPRFDFRDAGLGHTLRLGVWTVLFVIVNQVAYTVVVRLASRRHRGRAARRRRHRATRSTPRVPDRDGPALRSSPCRSRPRSCPGSARTPPRATSRAWPARWRRRCAARSRWWSRSRCCCR